MGISKQRKQQIEKYLSKENLKKYLKKYSANYIATKLFAPEFITHASTVIDRANKFGIQTHNASNARKLQSVQHCTKKTLYTKYGVTNASQAQFVKDKKEQKALEKYGVRNVFQSEIIKQKLQQTNLEKYGVEKIGWLQKKNNHRRSKFHRKIEDLLVTLNINYESEVTCKFIKYNKELQKKYSPIVDILIEEHKLVIECYGDFWHANPKIYTPNDIFYTFYGKRTSQEIWDFDNIRINHIKNFGYKVLIIWEYDYFNNLKLVKKNIYDIIKN